MIRSLILFALLLSQTNVFAIQSDTLNLEEVVLKSALINQSNPALRYQKFHMRKMKLSLLIFKMQLIFLQDFGLQTVKIKHKIIEWQ